MDRKHTYELLEFDLVLNELATHSSNILAKNAIFELEASNDSKEVEKLLNITEEAFSILSKNHDFTFTGKIDIYRHLEHVNKEGFLVGDELLDIINHIENVVKLTKYAKQVENKNNVYFISLVEKLSMLSNVATELERCINVHGDIKESASFEIRKLKKQISSKEVEVKNKLNTVMNKKSKMLSENIITIRNNRQVVAVKQEFKHIFGGLIHDESLSGQTIYVEPEECVQLNHNISELKVKLKNEIEKIFIYLSKTIDNSSEEFKQNLYVFKEVDLMFAKARYAIKHNSFRLRISEDIKLYGARHPLIPRDEVVENDIILENRAMIITGANTGGKTVTLKTVGLFSLMNQCGLFCPTRDKSCIPIFNKIFAQMGDNQSLGNNLSTFSAHIMELKFILNNVNSKSLVLLDEVGSGTNPNEGSALAIAIIDSLINQGVRVFATTHYNEIKEYAIKNEKVSTASVKFDEINLNPTYRLLLDTVGVSYAILISERLGISKDIINKANKVLEENTDENMLILDRISEEKNKLLVKEDEIKRLLLEQKNLSETLSIKESAIDSNATTIVKRAKEEANAIINDALKKSDSIVKELSKSQKHHQSRKKMKELEQEKFDLETRKSNDNIELIEGDEVLLLPFETKAKVLKVHNSKKIDISIGNIKSTVKRGDLIFNNRSNNVKKAVVTRTVTKSIKNKLDLRGMRVYDAQLAIENYFDEAKLSKLSEVTVVHGYGTGAIRNCVVEFLDSNKYEYRSGGEGEGGSGSTIVKL